MNNLQRISAKDVQIKLTDIITETSWSPLLRSFISGIDFEEIIEQLIYETEQGKRFVPKIKDVLNPFKHCPYNDLKVIIIGQDPYPWLFKSEKELTVADGLAFSCGYTMRKQPSLDKIQEAIGRTVYNDPEYLLTPDLRIWADQGVLLLNSAFTTELNKPGTHYHIWKSFLVYLIDSLNYNNQDIVYILLGKVAQQLEELIDDSKNLILKAQHPAAASYNKTNWDCNDVFNKANAYIASKNKEIIQW